MMKLAALIYFPCGAVCSGTDNHEIVPAAKLAAAADVKLVQARLRQTP